MSVWAIMSAPLLLGNDPRHVTQEVRDIMQHEQIIKINQDPDGIQGIRIQCDDLECNNDELCNCKKQAWIKPLAARFVGKFF